MKFSLDAERLRLVEKKPYEGYGWVGTCDWVAKGAWPDDLADAIHGVTRAPIEAAVGLIEKVRRAVPEASPLIWSEAYESPLGDFRRICVQGIANAHYLAACKLIAQPAEPEWKHVGVGTSLGTFVLLDAGELVGVVAPRRRDEHDATRAPELAEAS